MAGILPAISFALDAKWLSLYYYQKDIFGNYESMVDSPSFFFHKEGKTNPQKELTKALEAFKGTNTFYTPAKQPAACAFPERFKYIQGKYPNTQFPQPSCHDLQEWKMAIGAKSISLVFSSAYANNPGSMFGHVLIKFNKFSPDIPHKDLQNYTASFGAVPDPNDNAVFYAVKGMFGGYRSYFTLQPYYVKTSEYNNSESRDLWDYELNIGEEKIDRILNHLWELYGSSWFDYYFFDENCSLYVSKLLEIAIEETHSIPYKFFTLPTDIVNRFASREGLIKKVHFRPSLKRQLASKWKNIDSLRHTELLKAFKTRSVPRNSNLKELDFLAQLIEYTNSEKKIFAEMAGYESKILNQLAVSEGEKPKLEMKPSSNRPDWGHAPSKIILGLARDQKSELVQFGYRGVLHDLYDFDPGYESFNKIELLKFMSEYDLKNKKFDLENFTIVSLQSLPGHSSLFPKMSWAVTVELSKTYHLPKRNSHMLNIEGGAGLSYQWSDGIFFSLLEIKSEGTSHYRNFLRIGPALNLGLFQTLGHWKLGAEVQAFAALFQGSLKNHKRFIAKFGASYQLRKNLDLRALMNYDGVYGKTKLGKPRMALHMHYHF